MACTPPTATPSTPQAVFVATGAASATATATPTPTPMVVPTPSAPASLSRWVPARGFLELGDGRRGAVIGGRRVVLQGKNASVVDAKPVVALGRPHRIPASLGGGWLFSSEKHLYAGMVFDGPLRLLASDVDETHGIGVGRDVVMVHGGGGAVVLESATGKRVASPVAGAEQLFGLKTGEVAVRTKGGDVFLSVSQAKPFTKVAGASKVEAIAYDGKGFVLFGPAGQLRLGMDGKISPRPNEPGMTSADDLFALQDEWPDMSKPPPVPDAERMLERLTVAMADGTVLVNREGALVAHDGKTGSIASTQPNAFAGHENCFPIRGGTPAFFGCNDQKEMTLLRIEAPARRPVVERTFKGVYTQDFGEPPPEAPLALGKRCDGSELRGAFCVRRDDGTWTEIAPPPDPAKVLASMPFVVHVAASRDGAPYAFGWENGNGALVVVDGKQKTIRRIEKSAMPAWAASGIRWDAMTVRDGTLRFLIHDKTPGVLEMRPDGSVEGRPLDGHLAAVGGKGLLVGRDGSVKETLDAGLSFHEVVPPPGGVSGERVDCVEGGCSVGPWLRLGWGP